MRVSNFGADDSFPYYDFIQNQFYSYMIMVRKVKHDMFSYLYRKILTTSFKPKKNISQINYRTTIDGTHWCYYSVVFRFWHRMN